MRRNSIESVLEKNATQLMSIPGVVGTAIGEYKGEQCITVFVLRKSAEIHQKVPFNLEGYTVRIKETGEFRALEG